MIDDSYALALQAMTGKLRSSTQPIQPDIMTPTGIPSIAPQQTAWGQSIPQSYNLTTPVDNTMNTLMPQQPPQSKIFGMPVNDFSRTMGTIAAAISPYSWGGRLGAGMVKQIGEEEERGLEKRRAGLQEAEAGMRLKGMQQQEQERLRQAGARQSALQAIAPYMNTMTPIQKALLPLMMESGDMSGLSHIFPSNDALAEIMPPELAERYGMPTGTTFKQAGSLSGLERTRQAKENMVSVNVDGKEMKLSPKDYINWAKNQKETGETFANLAPDKKDIWYEQYKVTGKLPPFAWKDKEGRDSFIEGYADYLASTGTSGIDAAVEKAKYSANSSALRDLTKREQLVSSFTNRIDANSKVVENLARKYEQTNSRLLNVPINALKAQLGSGEWQSLNLALTSLSNEIAKVESGSLGIAEVSVSQAERMAKIHDPNLSVNDLMKVINTGKELSKTSKQAFKQQKMDLETEMKGKSGEGETPAASNAPVATKGKTLVKQQYNKSLNKTRFFYSDGSTQDLNGNLTLTR